MTSAMRESAGLAAAWRLLSLGFSPPTPEALAEVGALAEVLADTESTSELDDVRVAVRRVSAHEVAMRYAALFGGKVLVAPYEASYELDPIRQGRQMADVAAFYRAFGAEANGPVAERPDFVGCELEFLSFLEVRRLVAVETNEPGVDVIEDIRDSFLAEHAGRWLPTFFAAVAAASDGDAFYRALALFGAAVLARELEQLGIQPEALPARRSVSSLDGDTLECGAAGPDPPL